MITGPRMSRKDLELSELEHFENTPGAPSSVLFLSQVEAALATESAALARERATGEEAVLKAAEGAQAATAKAAAVAAIGRL